MIEIIVLLLFAVILSICVIFDISVLAALVVGYVLFAGYAVLKKYKLSEIASMSLEGIKTVKGILITFILIGIITSLWRLCGTIPYIVYLSVQFLSPDIMVLLTFLLCCLISSLTGTAFGTAATIGVICSTLSKSMGVSSAFIGGAILAGSYFGDRCSPMSTSALLVSSLTKTDIFKNIKTMIKISVVPFLISCVIYYFLGVGADNKQIDVSVKDLFSESFDLNYFLLIPAAVIVILSLFKINVRITMLVSIACSAVLCLWFQHVSVYDLAEAVVFGYKSDNVELSRLLSGGGILSMRNVFFIVCISSCYSGIFKRTGLLNGIRNYLNYISSKTTSFCGIIITSLITSLVACNQTLTIMLTHHICEDTEKNKDKMAEYLENTAVVIAPLVPWSIAGAVPLSSVEAPTFSIIFAFYLYILPIFSFLKSFYEKRKVK